jgi:hypothetical protein
MTLLLEAALLCVQQSITIAPLSVATLVNLIVKILTNENNQTT